MLSVCSFSYTMSVISHTDDGFHSHVSSLVYVISSPRVCVYVIPSLSVCAIVLVFLLLRVREALLVSRVRTSLGFLMCTLCVHLPQSGVPARSLTITYTIQSCFLLCKWLLSVRLKKRQVTTNRLSDRTNIRR